MHRSLRVLPLLCALALALPAVAQEVSAASRIPVPADVAYPGKVRLEVDATDLARRIIRVRQTLPVAPGRLTLLYPQWLPGNHGPYGPLDKLAGLRLSVDGRPVAWRRDPLDVHAFHVDVPAGASSLVADYQFISPTDPAQGRVVMTPNLLNLQWNTVVLYPAGHHAHRITYAPRLRYPAGFDVARAATSLEVERIEGDTVVYREVPLDVLVDSPVFAGRHARQFDLAPGARVPVRLNVVADAAKSLEAKPEQIERHRRMVEQALRLFGAQHYDRYDFLFALSEQMSGIGLEHQRSSENGLEPGYFTDFDAATGFEDLLAHEFVHSWNGKYRRPADLATPNFNVPMQDSLLWVYEGQTQYWGQVLTARSGMRTQQNAVDALALVAAAYAEGRPGLQWRTVQDTTNDPIIAMRRAKSYRGWQLAEDYYSGGQLIWLEADATIRALTHGRRSLDDFARAFFGVDDGQWRTPRTYTFEDVVATLDGVVDHDWAGFLRARLDGDAPLIGGLEAAGWRLVFREEPNALAKARGKHKDAAADFVYSLGLSIGKEGKIGEVRFDSPAFDAGLGTAMTLVAVNDREYSRDALAEAITAAKAGGPPIRLLVKTFDRFQAVDVDYRGGLRYPHLERIPGTPDRLAAILAPKR